jgi:hypothetical protein
MSPMKKQPAPPSHPDEQSSVRDSRTPSGHFETPDSARTGRSSSPQLRIPQRRISSPEIVTPKDARIGGKVARAEELLAMLPPSDPRARLLEVALLRRDEALIDGILTTLENPRR